MFPPPPAIFVLTVFHAHHSPKRSPPPEKRRHHYFFISEGTPKINYGTAQDGHYVWYVFIPCSLPIFFGVGKVANDFVFSPQANHRVGSVLG